MAAKSGLKLNNRKYETVDEKVPFCAVTVICRDDIIVPANSEFIFEGEGNSTALGLDFALISPNAETDINGVIVGNSLIKTNLPVRVANVTCENLTVKKGKTLGFMQGVKQNNITRDSFVRRACRNSLEIDRVTKGTKVNVASWSEPLQDLFYRSCEKLNETLKTSLCQLLDKINTSGYSPILSWIKDDQM